MARSLLVLAVALGFAPAVSASAASPAADHAATRSLTKAATARALIALTAERRRQIVAQDGPAVAAKTLTIADKTMKWGDRDYGNAPFGKRSLWISLHGGGNAAPAVNEQQWHNQIRLYQPAEGLYLAPRAPTNTWNLWHEPHIDPLLQRLIDAEVAINGIDPNRVYLMG